MTEDPENVRSAIRVMRLGEVVELDGIQLTVLRLTRGRVTLGIEAPRDVRIGPVLRRQPPEEGS